MAAHHGNTPAAWTGVAVAMVGFVVGSIAMMLDPINTTVLWVGIAVAVLAFPLFLVLDRMGYNGSDH